MTEKRKKKYIVTESEMMRNRHPLNSLEEAHLFYGVPFNMNAYEKDPRTGNLIFYESKEA